MRMLSFASRNTKEILRDPINLAFGLGFPLILILLLSAIHANIPVKLFEIGHLTPGITVFGLSFMSLFFKEGTQILWPTKIKFGFGILLTFAKYW